MEPRPARTAPTETPPSDGVGGGPMTAAEEVEYGVDETSGSDASGAPIGPWIAVALVLLAVFVALVVIGLLPKPA